MSKLKSLLQRLIMRVKLRSENRRLVIQFLWVCLLIFALLYLSALLAWIFERNGQGSNTITSFWDGIWWAIVTVATVGYGDKFPITYPGRLVGIILITVGFAALSVFTGLIASLFVEDKLKGAKGLKQIRTHDHVLICGWNNTGDFLLKAMLEKNMQNIEVCILANETPEFFEHLESCYPTLSLRFVRGEATQEETLKRAAVSSAGQVIILADQNLSRASADDRSIIIANTIHYLVKKEKITVQLINTDNRTMLQRIGISNIIVWEDIGGYILANNIVAQNNLSVFYNLAKDPESHLQSCKIQDNYLGKSFGELHDWFYRDQGQILLGLLTLEPELDIAAIFTDDNAGVDQFIKAALSKSNRLLTEEKSNVRWNPSRDTLIQANDYAIVLCRG